MPESPRYLVKVGRLDDARKVFQTIATWNGTVLEWDETRFMRFYSAPSRQDTEIDGKENDEGDLQSLLIEELDKPASMSQLDIRKNLSRSLRGDEDQVLVRTQLTNIAASKEISEIS